MFHVGIRLRFYVQKINVQTRTLFNFFLLFSLVLSSCNQDNDINSFYGAGKPDEITYSVTMYYSDMGKSKLKLASPEVYRYDVKSEAVLECPKGMELTFFDSLQGVESVLVSDYGKLYTNEQYLFVKDNVVFYNNKKDTLFTDLLHIYFEKDSLYTDKEVKVSSESGVVFADELVANSNFTFYQLLNIKDSHFNYEEQ